MAEIKHEYRVTAREFSIQTHGLDFLCICGKHINGGYVAFPYWGMSAELSASVYDEGYNADKLYQMMSKCNDNWLPKSDAVRRKIADELAERITPLLTAPMLSQTK